MVYEFQPSSMIYNFKVKTFANALRVQTFVNDETALSDSGGFSGLLKTRLQTVCYRRAVERLLRSRLKDKIKVLFKLY